MIQSGNFLDGPIQALLQAARQHGTKVLVVEMPVHPLHLRRFYAQPIWQTFRAKTREAVETAGAGYLNASDWITDSHLFADPLHLSKEGGTLFSHRLAERLLEQPQCCP